MRRSKIALAVAVGILAAAMPGHALAGGAAQYLVSGRPYSLAPLCRSHGVDGEVSLAIDHHTGRMVAAWMQDIGPTASLTSSIVLTAASTDGGRTWTRTVPSGVMLCERPPGPDDGVFDPSVSVGPDGRWYLARGGAEATPAPGGSSQIFVTTSKDGVHWGRPVLVPAGPTIDFDTLVADPKTAGRAYVTWSNYTTGLPVPDNQVMMSVTSNGGRTFSLPRIVHAAPLGHVDVIAHLVVL
ncbi:MAG TPA: sialidase family protein, partial [Actinomycetota bacterium]